MGRLRPDPPGRRFVDVPKGPVGFLEASPTHHRDGVAIGRSNAGDADGRQVRQGSLELEHVKIGERRLPGCPGIRELVAATGSHGVGHATEGDAGPAADVVGRQYPAVAEIDPAANPDRPDVVPARVIGRGGRVRRSGVDPIDDDTPDRPGRHPGDRKGHPCDPTPRRALGHIHISPSNGGIGPPSMARHIAAAGANHRQGGSNSMPVCCPGPSDGKPGRPSPLRRLCGWRGKAASPTHPGVSPRAGAGTTRHRGRFRWRPRAVSWPPAPAPPRP